MAQLRGFGLDLHTEYTAEGDFTFNTKHEGRACFAGSYSALDNRERNRHKVHDVTYHIVLYKGFELALNEGYHWNNACPYDVDFITNHLSQLNSLYPIGFTIDNLIHRYVVNLHIKDAPALFHKYALCWVRYMYEFPFNMASQDLYRLAADENFQDYPIHSLYAILFASFPEDVRHRNGHSIMTLYHKMLQLDELKERLTTRNYKIENPLHGLFPRVKRVDDGGLPYKLDGINARNTDYWDSDEIYQKYRLPYYKNIKNELI